MCRLHFYPLKNHLLKQAENTASLWGKVKKTHIIVRISFFQICPWWRILLVWYQPLYRAGISLVATGAQFSKTSSDPNTSCSIYVSVFYKKHKANGLSLIYKMPSQRACKVPSCKHRKAICYLHRRLFMPLKYEIRFQNRIMIITIKRCLQSGTNKA